MSVVYTLLYFVFVTPAGFLYRFLGGDVLRLRSTDTASAFVVREHEFGRADFESVRFAESAPSKKPLRVLGISAYYHDSAAALVVDGTIVAAAHEERFTRRKHDASFPRHAVAYCLAEAGIDVEDLDAVVFYEQPRLKFKRLLMTYVSYAPRGLESFVAAMHAWAGKKLSTRSAIGHELKHIAGHPLVKRPLLLFSEHHLSHAASAFYASPFKKAAILTIDGVGEWATTTIGVGEGDTLSVLREMHFPHSLGLLYSAFTYYCGFKINSGEYKLMGLAPYGRKGSPEVAKYKQLILHNLISPKKDGSFFLMMEYFTFAAGLRTVDDAKWERLFGFPARSPEAELRQEYMDLALAIQEITDEAVVRLAKTAKELTGADYLVMAGGVALNCVSNQRVRESGIFRDVWIQPAAGDAGGALGAALAAHCLYFGGKRIIRTPDAMEGSYLGPAYSDDEILLFLKREGIAHRRFDSFADLCTEVARRLADDAAVGWFQGRMEWGPRSLGNRSILADPRSSTMQKKLNLKIKFREGFRPFAPAVLQEDAGEYFETKQASPYMLFTAPVVLGRRKPQGSGGTSLSQRLNTPRSDVPAITHLDYSARLQTVSRATNGRFFDLLQAFKKETGYGILVNTSFNVRGEPIVMTPEEAYRCFMDTHMDYLVLGNILLSKADQPNVEREKPRAYAID